MLDCWNTNSELRPSFLYLKQKTEEFVQHVNQNYTNIDFNLIDCLSYCNLQMNSEVVNTENITDDNKQDKENDGSEIEEVTEENCKGTTI